MCLMVSGPRELRWKHLRRFIFSSITEFIAAMAPTPIHTDWLPTSSLLVKTFRSNSLDQWPVLWDSRLLLIETGPMISLAFSALAERSGG
jgi:hypothetical protein